jgi:hypothetical protein
MKIVDANTYIPRSYDKSIQAQVLELWSSGYPPDVTPHILWTTGQRMPRIGENAYIQGIFECLSVVQPGWPTGQRMIDPAWAKRLCVCVGGAMQSILGGCPGLTGPPDP